MNLDNLIVITWKLADIGSDLFENISSNLVHIENNYNSYFKLETCERILLVFTCSKTYLESCETCDITSLSKICISLNLNMFLSEFPNSQYKIYIGVDAFRHLCSVASSLDSSTLGEPEILGQFKKAVKKAKSLNKLHNLLEETLIFAYKAGKKVHASSDIPKGRISILSNIEGIFNDWIIKNNLNSTINLSIIGTGKMGLDANRYFVNKNVNISIYSRNRFKTHQCIDNLAIKSFDDFDLLNDNIDVIVLCSSTVEPFFTKEYLIEKLHLNQNLLIFDLGVPRNASTEISSLVNVSLYQMEQLVAISLDNKKQREALLPIAYSIIDQQVEYVRKIFEKRKFSPLIKGLRSDMQKVAERRLSNYSGNKNVVSAEFYKWFNNTVKELMHVSQQHLESSLFVSKDLK